MKKLFVFITCLCSCLGVTKAEEQATFILEEGIQFNTKEINNGRASIGIDCPIQTTKTKGVRVKLEIFYELTNCYSRTLTYKEGKAIHYDASINNAHLWTPEYPNLYRAVFSVWEDNVETSRKEILFPIRTVEISNQACMLNGKRLILNGVWIKEQDCFMPTHAIDAFKFRIKWLRSIGCNAICCTTGNTPTLQAAADKVGVLLFNSKKDDATKAWIQNFVTEPLEYGYQPTPAYYKYLKLWKKKDAACFTTTDAPARIELIPDYVGDVTYVHIRLLGENNYLCTKADNSIEVRMEGEGKLLGLIAGSNITKAQGNTAVGQPEMGILTAVVQGNGNVSGRSKNVAGCMLQINSNR